MDHWTVVQFCFVVDMIFLVFMFVRLQHRLLLVDVLQPGWAEREYDSNSFVLSTTAVASAVDLVATQHWSFTIIATPIGSPDLQRPREAECHTARLQPCA